MTEIITAPPQIPAWDLSHLAMSPEQTDVAVKLQAWLSTYPSVLAQAIAKFEGGTFTPDQMRLLEQGIIGRFRPLPLAAQVLQVLCKVVDAINLKTAPPLPTPRIPNLSIRPKNPFHTGIPASLSRTRIWRNAMAESIGLPRQSSVSPATVSRSAHRLEFGKLFASAILNGGLADTALLAALARALGDPKNRFVMINNRLAIELSISWRGEAGSEHRHWYPDVLTATLIARLADGSANSLLSEINGNPATDQHVQKMIWQFISVYLQSTTLKKPERPHSFGDMLRTVQIDLQTRLPQVLVNYAGRKLISHSPEKHVVARIHRLSIIHAVEPRIEEESMQPAELITEFNQTSDNLNDLEPCWLNGLRKCFSSKKSKDVKELLDALAVNAQSSSVEECFTEFARFLVASLSVGGHKLAISTAKSYLVAVAKRLGGRLGGTDPRSLCTETLEILYGEILEDADYESGARKQRRRIARALREFHNFLVQRFQFEPINPREVLGIGKGLVLVDANLITPDEYEHISRRIPETIKSLHPSIPAQAKLTKAAQLIFMLSFRCGLRRMEVLMLKNADFSEHTPAELLIRPSDARRLKTKSATRKMPLYALLPENDLAELRNWKIARKAEIAASPTSDHEQFLFGIPELDFDFIPQDTIFPIIHHAMREVTGDPSMRFHHLRHSFANWTFLQLMLADLPNIPELFPHLPITSDLLGDSKRFRDNLYGRSDPTRRHVYAVASLLGHSGPDISLEHYIHFCDLLLAHWLGHDTSAPTDATVIVESRRPQSTTYRWRACSLQHIPYQLIKKRWPNLVRKPQKTSGSKPTLPIQSSQSGALKLDDPAIFNKVWELLFQHGMHGTPLGEVAALSGFSDELAAKFIQIASEIRDMKTSRGGKGHRHRMIEVAMDRRNQDTKTRLACPVAPHTKKDKEIATVLAPRMLELIKTKPELCDKVFAYYLNNAWQTRSELIFKDPMDPASALQFLNFLSDLGIKKSELVFISYDTSIRSSHLAMWKEKLGLSSRHRIEKNAPPRKSNQSAKKWLGIKPVFSNENGKNSVRNVEQESSIAFRYLMILGALISRVRFHSGGS